MKIFIENTHHTLLKLSYLDFTGIFLHKLLREIGIFLLPLYHKINIIMINSIFSPSLFPKEKGDFDPKDFESKLSELVLSIIRKSYSSAISVTNSLPASCTLRARANTMHDVAYGYLRDNFAASEYCDSITFISDPSGNKRKYIIFYDYVIILHKDGASSNNTKVAQVIQEQSSDLHILTLNYTLNDFGDEIVSLRFTYPADNYSYTIPMVSSKSYVYEDNPEATIPEPIKPKLKKSKLKEAQ